MKTVIRSLSRDLNRKGAVDSALFAQLTHGRAHEFVAIVAAYGVKLPSAAAKGEKYKDTFVKACKSLTGASIAGTKHEKAAVLGAVAVAAGLMSGTVQASDAPARYTVAYAEAVQSLTPAKTEAQIAGALKAQATREAKAANERAANDAAESLKITQTVTALQICDAIKSGRFDVPELQAIQDALATVADLETTEA